MLRHYDALGLVCPSARTTGGYRRYSPSDIERLLHVESLRSLGLSLAEVKRALDDAEFTALLREALGDPDDVVRSRAAIALGRRGDDTATAVLIALIADGADGIDDVAAGEALGHLASDKKRAAGIVADLVAHAANAPSPVRRRVVQALAELPATAARPALEPFTRDPEPGVALTAVALLRRLDS